MPGLSGPAAHVTSAQVFVADVGDAVPDPEDVHHLARVLRLRPGEPVVAADGAGAWRMCRFRGAGNGATLEPDGPVTWEPEPIERVTVAFAPVKGDRPDWTVQKLTEIGVDRMVVLRTGRSVVRWEGDRVERALDRLRRVAREAAAQSRRAWLPVLEGMVSLDEAAQGAEARGAPLALAHPGAPAPERRLRSVAVGPEGGWEPAELARGLPTVGLGPCVLRAETAAMAAAVVLCARRDGLIQGPDQELQG